MQVRKSQLFYKAILKPILTQKEKEATHICSGGTGRLTTSPSLTVQAQRAINFTHEPHLFSVGNTTVRAYAVISVSVSCKQRRLTLYGNIEFRLEDAFIDAFDIFNVLPGNQDLGTPYRFTAVWKESVREAVYF